MTTIIKTHAAAPPHAACDATNPLKADLMAARS